MTNHVTVEWRWSLICGAVILNLSQFDKEACCTEGRDTREQADDL